MKYLTVIDVSLGYDFELDDKTSYMTTFSCSFGRYLHIRLPLGTALVGYMLQKKIDELFKGVPNVFDIADDILIAGYDEGDKDHDEVI